MRSPPGKSCPRCGEPYDADVLFCPRDGTPLQTTKGQVAATDVGGNHDPYLGVDLAGQIRLQHLIGIGSMGRVYRAWQGGIERDVAVKILHRELSGNGELVKRFHREAKVASRLVHPNVVQVLMTGTVPFVPDPHIGGEMYLIMEYLDGISLLSALAAAGTSGGEAQALPLPRALHIALQICDAVGEAHAQQIVHRDLKPENVMLVRRGEDRDFVKVLDFGIARLDWGEAKGMETQAGMIFGTAKYISPEGAEGHPVTPPGDVYAIATMLYQMLAGRTPFEGDSSVALLVQHAHAPPRDLREIARASYVPAPIAEVVMKNLAKKAADRAATARHLGRDLVAAARASGLFPEELTNKNTLLTPGGFGAVKLLSKERTKALELSVELANKIGGVAAPGGFAGAPRISTGTEPGGPMAGAPGRRGDTQIMEADEEEIPKPAMVPVAPTIPGALDPRALPPPLPQDELDVSFSVPSRLAGAPRPSPTPTSRPGVSRPGASRPGASRPGTSRPGVSRPGSSTGDLVPELELDMAAGDHSPELDFDDAGALVEGPLSSDPTPSVLPAQPLAPTLGQGMPAHVLAVDPGRHAAGPPPIQPTSTPTIQGTEQSLVPAPPPQPRLGGRGRWIALAAALLVIAPVAVLGGRRLAGGGSQGSDAIDATLEEARACIRSHAWTEPAGHNAKELLDEAKAKWPNDGRVRDLRQEAAEKLVTEALGRKYAQKVPDALRLSRLAHELDPENTTAQHLVQELEGAGEPAEPVAVPTAAASPDRPAPPRPIQRPGNKALVPVGPVVPKGTTPPPKSSSQPRTEPPPEKPEKPVAPAGTGPFI